MTRRQYNAALKAAQKKLDAAFANIDTVSALYEAACEAGDDDKLTFYWNLREQMRAQIKATDFGFPEKEMSPTDILIANNCD